MDTRSRWTRSFAGKLLLSVGGAFLLFAACFSAYQYGRERKFKTDILDASLRAYALEMASTLGREGLLDPEALGAYAERHRLEGLRITVVDSCGNVLADTSGAGSRPMGNHLSRKEIAEAFSSGAGHDIKRTSASTHETYFYSATRLGDMAVRVAVPYSAELTESLRADGAYLWFALALTAILGLVLYTVTSRISRHVRYLREFAIGAERGTRLDHEKERSLPDDELGDICHTITTLYWKLRESEEDKERLKRQLTQNAAHELKTPASSIHGYLESIIANPGMPEDRRRHFLERCYAQSERMVRLLQDMSTLMRLDEGRAPLPGAATRAESVDVASLARAVLDDVAPELEQRGIAATVDIPGEVHVAGDRSLLYGIFRNIVDNSIAYAAGADRISVCCTGTVEGDGCLWGFSVSDNGQGVAPEHLPHLFERFYRVDRGRSRKAGGTGLGLAIVKNAVQAHGGQAWAETTPGGGLTIRFTLGKGTETEA